MPGTKAAVQRIGREMPHILVVDDEKSISNWRKLPSERRFTAFEVAHNVEAAKTKLESQIFDIIIRISACLRRRRGSPQIAKEIAPGSFFLLINRCTNHWRPPSPDQLWSRPLRH